MHFRKTLRDYTEENLKNPRIRRLLQHLAPADGPALFLLMVLGYLERGYLTRPVGGTERFRDELIRTYERLGGESLLHATVDEVLVKDGRAVGVRLDSGALRDADVVISTSSAPETIQRLLGGRFGAAELEERLSRWKLFDPIVLASFGVEASLADVPSTLLIDHIAPLEVGGKQSDYLYVRVFNDDPAFAPPGHSVVQAMLPTTYEYWAKQGSRYGAAKDDIAERVLARLAAHIPGLAGRVRMTDVATPLTYWSMSRSWRGAFEGWMPNSDSFLGHVKKTLPGLTGFYMAGQWVEPGGGVPVALMSGRQVAQLVCNDLGRTFVERPGEHTREPARAQRQLETAAVLGR
jgi:phytoene dehydrogenase-like protein